MLQIVQVQCCACVRFPLHVATAFVPRCFFVVYVGFLMGKPVIVVTIKHVCAISSCGSSTVYFTVGLLRVSLLVVVVSLFRASIRCHLPQAFPNDLAAQLQIHLHHTQHNAR